MLPPSLDPCSDKARRRPLTPHSPSDKMPTPLRTRLVRYGLAGALSGLVAGVLDFALAWSRLGAFLPTGRLRFLGFLVGLYGTAGLACGLLLGALVALLADRSDLGVLVASATTVDGAPASERLGARIFGYVLAGVLALAAVGFVARALVEAVLVGFHHRQLIGLLSGAALATLGVAFGLVALLVAPLLSRVLPFGPRLHLVLRGAPLVAVPAVVLGVYVAAGTIALEVVYLLGRPRMNNPVRALNAAMAAPLCCVLALAVGYGLYRALGRTGLRSVSATVPRVVTLSLLVAGLPLLIGAAVAWSTVRQLDLRSLGVSLWIVLATLLLGHALRTRRPSALALVAALLLVGGTTLGLGRVPRVRKATSLVGLAPQLVRGIQRASDLDRDGYSSLLGGGDCNDLDRRVHPGAFDCPDDGIDQDCNGHEATLVATEQRTYAAVPAEVPEAPNVILLSIDALRADHLSAYGYARPTSPNLDALARDGVRFENGWSHAPSTRYSVPAILTGRYPSTIAVNNDPRVHWPPLVLPENRLLAEMMKDLGYRTAATLSYHYFEPGWGLDQGFDDYDYHLYTLHSVGGDPSATSGSSSRELADVDIAWLRAHASERFFLWSHFYDTHFQFQAHPDLPESNFGTDEMALYDAEIRYTDHQLGRLFDVLKELGLWEKTIIVVTADHGDGFGEHGIPISRRHGYHLYRTETKVPILLHAPGLPPRVVATPAGHVDLIPTLLNLLRRPATEEPQLAGQSLLAAILGDEHEKDTRAIYQEVWFEGPTSLKALVTRGHHLIRNLVPDDTTELYDLVKDPAEEHDLSGFGDAVEAGLLARLGKITDALAIPANFATHLKDGLSRTAGKPSLPLDDELGDLARVVGVDIDRPTLRAGETAVVTVHFQVKRAIPDGYVIFGRAVASNGRSMNLDHTPLQNLVPMTDLQAGMWLRDPIAIAIPAGWPPGPLRVELGLYRKGERAKARGPHSAGDAVTVATLTVAP